MTWPVIRVRSKDVQKQLARTSLGTHFTKQTLNLNYLLLTLNVTEKAILFLNLKLKSNVIMASGVCLTMSVSILEFCT